MANVLITGASGLIGKPLSDLFIQNGHTVVHLGRQENLNAKIKCYKWDIPSGYIDSRAIEGIDTIIHLAGAGIADKRWTKKRKQEIIDSRIKSSQMLSKEINKRPEQIKTFIGSSAIGYYGAITSPIIFDETMAPNNDFMSTVCRLWEESYSDITEKEIRKVIVRIGVVLSNKGGALKKLAGPIKAGFGSVLGSGKQFVPWIHINDLVYLFYEAATNENYKGIYNAVANQHITNKELTREIALTLNKKIIMPNAPAFILKLILGEMSAMVLAGSRVSNQRILGEGFLFRFPELKPALFDLLEKDNKKAH